MSAAGDHENGTGPGPSDADRGETRSNVKGRPAPRLPRERDESSDSASAKPSEVMQQAHDDVEAGKTETDRGETSDEVYRRTLRGDIPGSERDADRGEV